MKSTRTPLNSWLKTLTFTGLTTLSLTSSADSFSIIEPTRISELWINPGFYSYHFQKNKELKDNNFGLGFEYRYSTISSITFGMFENSDRQTSHYAGWYWQPIEIGQARFGIVAGGMDGYPKMLKGGWFVAVIPTASIEYKGIGANLMFIPSIKNDMYESISLQLKIKIF